MKVTKRLSAKLNLPNRNGIDVQQGNQVKDINYYIYSHIECHTHIPLTSRIPHWIHRDGDDKNNNNDVVNDFIKNILTFKRCLASELDLMLINFIFCLRFKYNHIFLADHKNKSLPFNTTNKIDALIENGSDDRKSCKWYIENG